MKKTFSEDEKQAIVEMISSGASCRQVQQEFNISTSYYHKLKKDIGLVAPLTRGTVEVSTTDKAYELFKKAYGLLGGNVKDAIKEAMELVQSDEIEAEKAKRIAEVESEYAEGVRNAMGAWGQ
ncbi:hypothetical protein FLM48_09685 [Shewanella sp. Scap07]|uniref:hypothetical protein n=1 Tax=Shewanella sp. Scap07 TaxID=2589987 RepID=UPI0015BCBE05|nr:hypothetical protein [Shewanella sp. Scap07]QLE85331.1 hypothetical protein FLM48_09685 [Shewanella sp. Scap07]